MCCATHTINGGQGPAIGDTVHYHTRFARLPAKVTDIRADGRFDLRVFGFMVLGCDFGSASGQWMWRKRDLKPIDGFFAYRVGLNGNEPPIIARRGEGLFAPGLKSA